MEKKLHNLLVEQILEIPKIPEKQIIEFICKIDFNKLLKEYSTTSMALTGAKGVDDYTGGGPNEEQPTYFYKDESSYIKLSTRLAERMGFKVVSYILEQDNRRTSKEKILEFLRKNKHGKLLVEYIVTSMAVDNPNPISNDEGPAYFIGSRKTYEKKAKDIAERIGFQVVNYIMSGRDVEVVFDPDGYDPVRANSFFPAGFPGEPTVYNQINVVGTKAYNMWKDWVRRISFIVGWTFLFDKDEKYDIIKQSKKEPIKKDDNLFEK